MSRLADVYDRIKSVRLTKEPLTTYDKKLLDEAILILEGMKIDHAWRVYDRS